MDGNNNAKNIHVVMLSKAYIKVEYLLQNKGKITFVLAHGMACQNSENVFKIYEVYYL